MIFWLLTNCIVMSIHSRINLASHKYGKHLESINAILKTDCVCSCAQKEATLTIILFTSITEASLESYIQGHITKVLIFVVKIVTLYL